MNTTVDMNGLKILILMVPLLLAVSTTAARPLAPKVEIQCILVEKAQIAQKPLAKEGKFGRANYGHQIVSGTKSVLAIRIFDDPDRGPDSETFKKATLELKLPPDVSGGSEVSVDVLRSHYAEGASGWVADGGYWWAKDPFARVHFRRDNNGLYATLKQNVRVTDGEKNSRRAPFLPMDVTCLVRTLPILKLTPWTGRVGTDWLSFYSQGVGD